MPVVPGLTVTIRAGIPYYRITTLSHRTPRAVHHKKVVNGAGAVNSRQGARYNYPGARTVYLAEDIRTCFAEKMFYFHREVLTLLDVYHHTGVAPPFQQPFVLWEARFKRDIPDVFDLNWQNASAMNVYPSLMVNPSQDYQHLKDRRAAIQNNGYQGLRVPSSRVKGAGNMVVLFDDQSGNVQSITPYDVSFRLVTATNPPVPFSNHALDLLDFTAGEVRMIPNPPIVFPQGGSGYNKWTRMEFNH